MKAFFPQFIRLMNGLVAGAFFNLQFFDPIMDHAPSPPDYIKHVCKGWCCLDDQAHWDNSVRDTLIPSIE